MSKVNRTVRFIISCPARSGSTMLNVLLASHPGILCHGEALVGDEKLGFLGGEFAQKRAQDTAFDKYLVELRETNPRRFLSDVVFNPQDHACVGAKFKTDEAFLQKYEPLQSIIRDDQKIKILTLSRRNVLAQYVSHQVVAHQTGTHLVRGDGELPRVKPIEIDIEHCLDYVKDTLKRQSMAAQQYRNHPVLNILYEDLVMNRESEVSQILQFLEVDDCDLATDTKKILPPPSEMVVNFNAVKDALIESGMVSAKDLSA